LLESLKKLEAGNLLICGAMSHMCIDATTYRYLNAFGKRT